MAPVYDFHDVARLPAPGDNVAIASRRLEAGTEVVSGDERFRLDHTLLEGHRFARQPIDGGAALLSWGLPFGYASRDIAPGTYVCNARILDALRGRNVDFELPNEANFTDKITPYLLDEVRFQPGEQVARYAEPGTFMGYARGGARGVGTRNYVVILGTSSRTAGYARALEDRFRGVTGDFANVDGVVAVAHTEGGGSEQPNNLDFVLRTLSGFMVHPNVGAVLAVDYGTETITNARVRDYMAAHDYPLTDVPHHFLSLARRFQDDLARGEELVRGWLPQVNAVTRSEQSLAHLNVALQCGGSDAFSGISGNPLSAWVAREIIRHGGAASLAETDELIGAEAYVLQNVRDLATARKFLATVAEFKERVAWHGHTAEGNPTGGNMFRGLYNIVLKSLGAAMKRHPEVRLDYVIDYGERMLQPGYYFMNSPGNDLESIAGQVAAGANMIFFITGNGSITNFPFVPTLKVVTTSQRFNMLQRDMDVNAGAYQDGTPMDELGRNMFDLTVASASGARTKGEEAGHAQVSLWRDWRQTDGSHLERLQQAPLPNGAALSVAGPATAPARTFQAVRTTAGVATDQIGLLLPTSLCSSQIARLIANRLNAAFTGNRGVSRFVALPHTEGCGVSSGHSEAMYARTTVGYLTHPLVRFGLLLEHGCEKTHNDYMANQLAQQGVDRQRFGWASVQMDGGIEQVTEKVEAWFGEALGELADPEWADAGLDALRLGLLDSGPVPDAAAEQLAHLTAAVVGAGGTVVLPSNAALLSSSAYLDNLKTSSPIEASLAYGQTATPGLHVMETPTHHWVETLTGLGATGVEILLAHVAGPPLQAHPMIPLLQVGSGAEMAWSADMDLTLDDEAPWTETILPLVLSVASRAYVPKLYEQGNTDFQVSRGLLGISM